MKEITDEMMADVSGAGANGRDTGNGYNGSGSNGRNRGGKGGAPETCNNKVGGAAIVGALAGIPSGPAGVVIGSVSMAVGTAIGCANNSPYSSNNHRGDAFGGNSNPNSVNGQCRW